MQSVLIYASNQHLSTNIAESTNLQIPTFNTYSVMQSIYAKSDSLVINYPNKNIQFFGNVNIKYKNHNLISDELTIFYNKKNNLLYDIYAHGHINYNNNYIMLTGTYAWINLNNKNINIHKSTYYLTKPYLHGSADIVMQRKNNRYTIIKNGDFTSCLDHNCCWNITGNTIVYDNKHNNIDIWNAYFKIKKIPIFYSPYMSLSLNKNNILKSYIPNIKYNNVYGLIFKIPSPAYLSKNFSIDISPYYISNTKELKLQTKINYSTRPGIGTIILNIISNNITHNQKILKNQHNPSGYLYWKHDGTIHKKWNFNINYHSNYFNNYFKDTNYSYLNTINNNMYQKFLCNYNNKHWDANLKYLGITHNTTVKKNNYNYTVAPQLEFNAYYDFHVLHNPLHMKIFNQLTKFIPENSSYPETIRIHTEPSLLYTLHSYWSNFNIETKLKFTHYQQKNTNYYNQLQHTQCHLQTTINRLIPQFKIFGKINLKNKIYILDQYQNSIEFKLQYLYVPFRFQENIGIYDSSMIHIDYNNFFNDFTYSGLDRIAPANQITNNIYIRFFNKTNELCYISIGQILNLSRQHARNVQIIEQHKHKFNNLILFESTSHWNINNHWNTHTEIQYDIQNHNLSFGTAILEYIGKNTQTLQTHYRYINTQYIRKILSNSQESIYYQTITQYGILMCFPIHKNWKISLSHYHNTKTKKLINQTLGIEYSIPCWNIHISFERKIIGFNNILNNNIYDDKIKLNFKISHTNTQIKPDSYHMLNMNTLPYQYMF